MATSLHNGHFFCGQSIHSLLFQPLHYSYLSTTATSLQWPLLHYCHLSTTATSQQWPPLYNGHFFGGQSIQSLLFQLLYNGHLSTTAIFLVHCPYIHYIVSTSLQRPPLHNGHLSITAIFLADSPYIHYVVSTSLQRLQRPLSSVPNVAVVERFNCNLTRFIANEDV